MNNTMTIQEVVDVLNAIEDKSQLCYVFVPDDLKWGSDRYPINSIDTSLDRHIDFNLQDWS